MRSWITRPIGAVLVAAAIAVTAAGGIVVTNTPGPVASVTPTPTPTPTATATPTSTPTPGLANLFVDTNGGTCTRQGTLGAYVNAAACGSLNAAYQVANPFDRVIVKTGTYPAQAFSARGTAMTSPGATFVIEDGTAFGQITFGHNPVFSGSLTQNTHWITLDGGRHEWTASGFEFYRVHDVFVDGAVVDKAYTQNKAVMWWGDTTRTTFQGVDFCCVDNEKIMEGWMGDGTTEPNAFITLRDSVFHDMRRSGGSGVHNECFLTGAAPNLTMDATHWSGCTVINFNMGAFGAAVNIPNNNWTIRNSIFESPTNLTENDKMLGASFFAGCNAKVGERGNKTGWVVENNLFEGPWYTDAAYGCGDAGMVFRNNVMRTGSNGCPGGTLSYNVFDRTCTGTGNVNAGSTATLFSTANFPAYNSSAVGNDWRYSASSVLINKADPSNFPSVDITGAARPLGGLPDAGPYEKG